MTFLCCKKYYIVSKFIYLQRWLNFSANRHLWIQRYSGDTVDDDRNRTLCNPMRMCREDFDKIIKNASQFKNKTLSYNTLLKGKQVCVVTTNKIKQISSYLFMWKAAKLMGADIMPFFIDWRKAVHKYDVGRMLSITNDIVLAEGLYNCEISQLATGCKVPVIYIACRMHHPLEGLAYIMTIREHFGKYDTLTFAWIGPGNPTLNTYMYILPKFGINIKYNCCTDPVKPVTPMLLKWAKKISKKTKTTITECRTPTDAIKDSHIIATTNHNFPNQTITLEMLSQANENWMLTHDLPRGKLEVDDDVFKHERNLAWAHFENLIFVCMALIKHSLEKEEEFKGNISDEE